MPNRSNTNSHDFEAKESAESNFRSEEVSDANLSSARSSIGAGVSAAGSKGKAQKAGNEPVTKFTWLQVDQFCSSSRQAELPIIYPTAADAWEKERVGTPLAAALSFWGCFSHSLRIREGSLLPFS
jgi:hypothetical protein